MKEIKRTYLLGEEWLYYKIYCGVQIADGLLATQIANLTHALLNENLISQWFFIRYNDPDHHLRLRLKLKDVRQLYLVVAQCNNTFKELVDQGIVWNLQTGTYQRELERYGPQAMEISETLFFNQSQLITQLLQEQLGDEAYFLKIVQLTNNFISCFGLTDGERSQFLKENALAYKAEFHLDKTARLALDKKYRGLKDQITRVLQQEANHTKTEHNGAMENISIAINRLSKVNVTVGYPDFIGSHIHMFINRAFKDRQRFYEMVIYSMFKSSSYRNGTNLISKT